MKPANLRISSELLFYYHGIGDSLLLSTVLYDLGQQKQERYLVGSPHPEIYRGNPFVIHLPFSQSVNYRVARILELLGIVKKITHIDYYQEGYPPKKHIMELLSLRLGLEKIPRKPVVFLDESEAKLRILPNSEKPWVAIQSTGNSSWTDNKNWGSHNFAKVVHLLSEHFSFVQIGIRGEPLLEGAYDLTGKLSLRKLFLLLRECKGFVGQVGFAMHASAAMSLSSVIVYGGFEAPWQSGYAQNANIYNPISCAPCWLEAQCPYQKKCMTEITPLMIAEELVKIINRESIEPEGLSIRW